MQPPSAPFVTCSLLSLALIAAAPYQTGTVLGLPWWVWLVIVAVIILITFGIILSFDWSQAGKQNQDEDEDK